MTVRKVWQQGDADGLCGLYALANFLRSTDAFSHERDKPDELLFYILEKCERLGWFKPHYIKDGYEEYQLKAVLDGIVADHQMPYRVDTLRVYHSAMKGIRASSYLKSAVDEGGHAIVDWGDSGHWVYLNKAVRNGFEIWDSDDRNEPIRIISRADAEDAARPNGIVILKTQET